MLNIFYGDMKEAVYNTASYFKYDYEDDWITDPFAIHVLNTDQIVHSMEELVSIAGEFI